MSVLKGEGTTPILFGTLTVPASTRGHTGYLARPDLGGEWPTVLLIPSGWGLTSAVKDTCRRIARWGIAALAVDPYDDASPARSASRAEVDERAAAVPLRRSLGKVDDFVDFITNPAAGWSNAEDGYGLLAFGAGGSVAAAAARTQPEVTALGMVGTPLTGHGRDLVDDLDDVAVPILGIFGREDERVPIEDVMTARSRVPHAEWVIYNDVTGDFMDDSLPDYDALASKDAIDRIVAFCEKALPARV